jgi:hypothetical protein
MKFCLCLFFALGAFPAIPLAAAPHYRLVDLTDDYVRFYNRTQGMPDAERVAAFKAELNVLFPGFYAIARSPGMSQERYDARVARSFQQFAEIRADFLRTAQAFVERLDLAHRSFLLRFPDLSAIGDIYLVHSLGEMDGGTRRIGDRVVLVFGADVMARHGFENETPFVHHELFHVYHQQYFSGCEAVWCLAWTEGLAVLAAAELNPDASDAELLLTIPEPIRARVDANLTEAACTMRAHLDSEDDAHRNALFSFGRLNERLPPRFGYYVGYLAAREARKKHSLLELARVPLSDGRRALEQSLAGLANCADTPR